VGLDLESLKKKVAAHVAEHAKAKVQVLALEPLAGGACQDNFRVDLAIDREGAKRVVLRSDAKASLAGSLRREAEYQVIRAAVAAGVKTPEARWLASGLVREGAGAYFLDWISGDAIGRKIVKSPELADARARLPEELAGVLAKVHAIRPADHPGLLDAGAAAASSFDPVKAQLAALRTMMDGMAEPHPAMELAYRWLVENAPAGGDATLAHGDFRTGNFMVTPGGLAGVLDWEFAHWGSPYYDLAWISVRDWRFGVLDKPVGGFARREPFYEAYERASGRKVDRKLVHYWEVLGNLRWAGGAVYQGERYTRHGEEDLELLAIGRRACEMEWEALRLIEKGTF
jgi:aminoglycoside phosphotransferase (APT) family kinase protein